jgi:hypothetical protein
MYEQVLACHRDTSLASKSRFFLIRYLFSAARKFESCPGTHKVPFAKGKKVKKMSAKNNGFSYGFHLEEKTLAQKRL